ncbi:MULTISPECIES: SDR family NAD(P)-dependent oxidoreductase [unclassified Chelatococcus]|uniref:SDR family NAD(P)-dependent oxidoreductase n=1 Tax=unclassified Chelatococcus TaxID=2638111 RepID=UPI001BCE8A76|nr:MULTISPECIES: SDR family NAD(P)-dependent oxidoreductase [unclassified Chelatococcus]MBS7743432.1 SDR family oxidoreductase [Chelatococcus sp. HY11]MBX3547191.1 SDR family oxidoreductase [Chelatococcus sp.]CAH1663872.1 SDR family oxidoreductase [Hyphomicrobiales bacterium]CAH1687953.1 SDR family oxidoreductase [Hyphomicrobiales bacterium]
MVAIVTGAAGGIGRAIVRRLMADGRVVIGLDIAFHEPSDADAVYSCDLTDHGAARATMTRITNERGIPTVLVNNAGYHAVTPFLELPMEQLEKTVAVNVLAPFHLAQLFARTLIAAGKPGAIVNMASISGEIGSTACDYAASKAAVINLTKSWSRDLAPHGVRVNAVSPGLIKAGMGLRLTEAHVERFSSMTSLKRLGDPKEIAEVVAFLASNRASYMTGANGGI